MAFEILRRIVTHGNFEDEHKVQLVSCYQRIETKRRSEWNSLKVFKAPIAAESRFLIYALVFTILCHGAAMLAMLFFLLPGMPSGTTEVAQRITYISEHPFLWKLGWFPWQMTALSDVILSLALIRTAWIPRLPAACALVLTLVAVIFEQPAEFRWTTSGIDLAKEALRTGNHSAYRAFEQEVFSLTSHWAALFYTLAAIFWSISLAKAGAWSCFMTRLSVFLWGLLLVISIGPLLFSSFGFNLVSAGNALGFNLMMIWFLGALYLVKLKSAAINQNNS